MARAHSFWVALSLLVVMATMVGALALTNTTLQLTSPPELRGRITSLYNLALLGLSPLGSLQVAEALGTRFAMALGGTTCVIYFLILLSLLSRLRRVSRLLKPEAATRPLYGPRLSTPRSKDRES